MVAGGGIARGGMVDTISVCAGTIADIVMIIIIINLGGSSPRAQI